MKNTFVEINGAISASCFESLALGFVREYS